MAINLTPEDVLKAAKTLEIDWENPNKTHLLAVARAYCQLPLPTYWKRVLNDEGNVLYFDRRSSRESAEHPQLKELIQLLNALESDPPKGYAQQCTMLFHHEDGASYVHDFALRQSTRADAQSRNKDVREADSHAEAPALEQQEQPEVEAEDEGSPAAESSPEPEPEAAADTNTSQEPEDPSPPAPSEGEAPSMESAEEESRMIRMVPIDLLESFHILSPDPEVVNALPRLRFYSWWYEDIESTDVSLRVNADAVVGGGLRRRYVTLDYDLQGLTFTMRSANHDQELVIPGILNVTKKSGGPVDVWDLHVGATLSVMGKPTTLMKADIDTSVWIEKHGKRLRQLRSELLAELQKYKPRAHQNKVSFDRGDRVHAGGLNLRFTVEQINIMLKELEQYRPAKAEKLRSRINIKLS